MVYSLLSDPDLMRPENLLIPQGDNPFVAFVRNLTHYEDIDTGSVYLNAYKKFCNISDRDLLAGIMLFIDKTHTDVQGRLWLEQVTFTLGIFNR